MFIKLKIFRFDPNKDEKPYYQTFEIEADPMDRLLDCLNRIRWEQDPTLSYRWSCGHGICGSDGMRINGIAGLLCQKLVRDFKEEREVISFKIGTPLEDMEREMLLQTLKATKGNKQKAAKLLGINVRTIHRKMEEIQGDSST